MRRSLSSLLWPVIIVILLWGCSDNSTNPGDGDGDDDNLSAVDTLDPNIDDDYSNISHISNFSQWGTHNVHDPTLIKHDGYYYMYSTDVYYGGAGVESDDPQLDPKIPIRKSKDLVNWDPIGHVFDEMPDEVVTWMRENVQNGYEPEAVWAPFIMKVDNQFRLYYSVPANDRHGAYLGLATSSDPEGPWNHQGLVLPTYTDSPYNGIDPAVSVDRDNGKHWLFYGSWTEGVHAVELDPSTGFRLDDEDTGHIVARRVPDNAGAVPMEGAEVLYHPGFDKYYMFVSYNELTENYNVRVGRADQPEGPYYDMFGREMSEDTDNFPKITAQYRFSNHSGWQGVGHTGLLRDGEDYYLASQGRLGRDIHLMNLHMRKIVWTEEGWPTLSPERYAAVPQEEITEDKMTGEWEHITLEKTFERNYYQNLTFTEEGTIEGDKEGSWSLNDSDELQIQLDGKQFNADVMRAWDWENDTLCYVFTGLNGNGISEWGKWVEE